MIDIDRLLALRSRFAELHADYQRRGAELRDAVRELTRDRALLFAMHPDFAQRLETMSTEDLKAAGVSVRAITAVRGTASAISRKQSVHEKLAARVHVWSAYMANVEKLAAEYQA